MAKTFHGLHSNSPRDSGKDFTSSRQKDNMATVPRRGGKVGIAKNTSVDTPDAPPARLKPKVR